MRDKGFNLADVLKGVSNLGTEREQIEYIDIDRIDDDPNNFYELSGIEELAANIELIGLQQPVRVRPNPEAPDRVIIVSGHRRRAAVRMLVEEGKAVFRQLPCIRERGEASAAMRELRLIYANSDTRKLSSADQAKQAERVEALLYQLKEEGVEFPGRMRDHVAQACQMSKSKLARLKVIRENLIGEYAPDYVSGKLSESAAYVLARFPMEFQRRLKNALKGVPTSYDLEKLLRQYEAGKRWEPELKCPDGSPCKRGDAFLRHDMSCVSFEACGGETCCLECSRAFSSCCACDSACSKAKAARKAKKDADIRDAEEKKIAIQMELKVGIAKRAKRMLAAVDSAGLKDNVELKLSSEYRVYTVKKLREWARGEFGDEHFYNDPLAPELLQNVPRLAKALHCSADYILELSDDLHPNHVPKLDTVAMPGGWVPLLWIDGREKPTSKQWAVAMFKLAGLKKPWKRIAYWNGKSWIVDKMPIEDPCLKWFPIPDDEEVCG